MDIAEHIAVLRDEGPRLAAAATDAGPVASVPSCPDWVVRDLVRHQGGVHRWATRIVSVPLTERWHPDLVEVAGAWPADGELIDWFRRGHAGLVGALDAADPALACWTFLEAPSPLAMWARRQAHETAMHRVDAELAAGGPVTRFAAPFAADGIDELLTCFITRAHGEEDEPGQRPGTRSLGVRCTDAAGEWLVGFGRDSFRTETGDGSAAGADCLLTGPASDLHLALWNRAEPRGPVTIEGDERVPREFADQVRIVWA